MKIRFLIIVFFLLSFVVAAENNLIRSIDAPNVIDIRNDSIFLTQSTTYAYSVDTPVGEGLINTGLTVETLASQIKLTDNYLVYDAWKNRKIRGYLVTGDILQVTDGNQDKKYAIHVKEGALSPHLEVAKPLTTAGIATDIVLNFVAGQRSPKSTVRFFIPSGVHVTLDNATVNVIGRGHVALRNLHKQSIGRTGTNYSYKAVGQVSITADRHGQIVTFSNLDLRPFNGIDVQLRIKDVTLDRLGEYVFMSDYSTSAPQEYHSSITPDSKAVLQVIASISDLHKEMPVVPITAKFSKFYLQPTLRWSAPKGAAKVEVLASADDGKNWNLLKSLNPKVTTYTSSGLSPDTNYLFKLIIYGGVNAGESNSISVFTGKYDVKTFGAEGDGVIDDTDAINKAIDYVAGLGGGIIYFPEGNYSVCTIHLKSNVWLNIDKGATIKCLTGNDAPETTWFSNRLYRSGLSPVDTSPYADPENYMTKQDVGHTYFRNAMFFAERQRNIKIFGKGRITGNGSLVTGDKVMNNEPEKRVDKMFSFKLCTQIEIGGYDTGEDMWYDSGADEPYYIEKGNKKNFEPDNMLHIDQGGHFVLLATGTDTIHVHDTYFGKYQSGSARDIYDFMGCNTVSVSNIYSRVSSDDIVKLGSDCSLGFTRPVRGYKVRNIIGDTNCNLFQIGSETADDIQDVYVDNIYVLGSNKAGFSISTNDGACIKNIFLNTGYTGKIHSRSKMLRTRAPFFISVSNRGRVIGADVKRFRFRENGIVRDELLCTNVNIGSIENIIINDIDISEVYGGSSFRGKRWQSYEGSQNEATPIIAGYKLPENEDVEGGLNFRLPDGQHTGYISDILFKGVNILVKGGHPKEDATAIPPEIGVGRYNVGDLKIQPAYGFWFRHAKNVRLKDCNIECEKEDGRHAIVFDDVTGIDIQSVKMPDYGARPLVKNR